MLTSGADSHFSAQYGNGIVGPIQIDGPASVPYDIDLGPLLLSDYYYDTAEEIVARVLAGGIPPDSDNVLYVYSGCFSRLRIKAIAKLNNWVFCPFDCFWPLINVSNSFNGHNIDPTDPSKGEYQNITLTPGKRHRLRLINTS